MSARQSLCGLLFFFSMSIGCAGSTQWEPIAENVCQKYQERIALLQSIQSRSDAKDKVALNERWQSEYERLVDQFANALLKHQGEMDFVKYNEFRNRWAQMNLSVNQEKERLDSLKDVGTGYDTDLLLITRTSFTNPFR